MTRIRRLTPTKVAQRLIRVQHRLRRRRIRIFGVGAVKTGTHTIAEMFAPHFRADHEADVEHFVPVMTAYAHGTLSDADLDRALRRRARTLGLEVDVAAYLAPIADRLGSMYPEARFILTVRDCFTWLESFYKHLVRHPNLLDPERSGIWRAWLTAQLPFDDGSHAPTEASLRTAGLPSVGSALAWWARANATVIESVPADRLLIIRTEDLDRAVDPIAEFCDIDPTTVCAARAYAAPPGIEPLRDVAAGHLVDIAAATCAPLMDRLWGPDWRRLVANVTSGEGSTAEARADQ